MIKLWRTGNSICTSRTKVSYNWTGPDFLTQNIWAKYRRRQPNPAQHYRKGQLQLAKGCLLLLVLTLILFIVTKSSDCVSYIIFIISAYHNLLIVVLLAMGLWLNSSERGIICTQAGPKWVTIGLVQTSLLRTFGPNTAGGSPAQHYKKGPLQLAKRCLLLLLLTLIVR